MRWMSAVATDITYIEYYMTLLDRYDLDLYRTSRRVWFGVSSILENGISGVGCSQFFESYCAYGADSIMWNVYANRVFGLVFFSDL